MPLTRTALVAPPEGREQDGAETAMGAAGMRFTKTLRAGAPLAPVIAVATIAPASAITARSAATVIG
jgi:hypothetical protein